MKIRLQQQPERGAKAILGVALNAALKDIFDDFLTAEQTEKFTDHMVGFLRRSGWHLTTQRPTYSDTPTVLIQVRSVGDGTIWTFCGDRHWQTGSGITALDADVRHWLATGLAEPA